MSRLAIVVFWLFVYWLSVAPAGPVTAGTVRVFDDWTLVSGVDWPHHSLEDLYGVGQAWGDANGDGWLDLYLTDHAGPNVLYVNSGFGSFTIASSSDALGLPEVPSAGAVFADYDNDGDQDLYVTNRGPNVLFRNDGIGGFVDVTATAGVGDPGKGSTASWGDFDRDGLLDLYVANWLHDDCLATEEWDCAQNSDRLYRNGGNGSFVDVTSSLGQAELRGLGFVASFVDYDNDGDLDIYLVNDRFRNAIGNKLFRNDGPGAACGDPHWCFTEVAAAAGADTVLCGMGLAVCDYDLDGDLDFYFSNAAICNDPPGVHHLLQNRTSQGSPTFVDVSTAAGVDSLATGWGTVCFDYDNDRFPDLYLAQSGPEGDSANRLYRNQGNGTFSNQSAVSGADDDTPTWGVAYADFDQDGWIDLITTNRGATNGGTGALGHRLYHNRIAIEVPQHRWLAVKLIGAAGVNRDAIGARVFLTLNDGRVHMQEVKSGSSLGAGNSLTLHFGLGTTQVVQELVVKWPDGGVSRLEDVAANQFLTVEHRPELFADGFESGDISRWSS